MKRLAVRSLVYNRKIYCCSKEIQVKVLIKKLIKNKITPSVQTSINQKYEIYYVDFLYENVDIVYQQLVSCAYDYPERNVHLIGYYNDEIVYDKIINFHE
jgi:hypothetical protein